jgi:hypothetical protein
MKELTEVTFDMEDDVYGDQIVTGIYTFGTGLLFENIWIDLAYQFGENKYMRTFNFNSSEDLEIKRDYSKLIVSTGMYF